MKCIVALVLASGPAWANCGGYEQTFLTCQIESSGKTLSVCFDEVTAIYRFGPTMAAPELELTTPIAQLGYTPWPGVGRAIWEEVVFTNNGHSYTVNAGLTRDFPQGNDAEIAEAHFGGVTVRKGDARLVEMACDPATIFHDWVGGLAEAKNRLGYVWTHFEQEWVALPD